jgi:hypothetical protein
MRAWSPVVAADSTCGPTSGSVQNTYSRIPAASADFAFFLATAKSAVVNRREPSALRNPNRLQMKNTCAGSSLIAGVFQTPSTCGSCSRNSQAEFACSGDQKNGGRFLAARFRSARKRFAASRTHFP